MGSSTLLDMEGQQIELFCFLTALIKSHSNSLFNTLHYYSRVHGSTHDSALYYSALHNDT